MRRFNTNVDWEHVILEYARDNDMTYREALGWLARRDTVEQAAHLLGFQVDAWENTRGMKHGRVLVQGLSDFLKAQGYKVPVLCVLGADMYIHDREVPVG